ncbi:hypothetical protein M409DRAFT_24434 [Zasmidium cellare ATCC 36951]|uniref:PRISE-like Rossmann-fold domain-containing protein n=1 Tax=Zasmidium cellare ATCC 36951 TaxID=1080233 RepID=A0A6A6CFW4_ZASCE|nr:uncharacterized protein M409DRAFT_24434 [Zasmidium cellare ATCC 36951]KAF2165048.1 hypothetical protein M409DRAFT_24434 [Zasmidium cellare ATCC 36951]
MPTPSQHQTIENKSIFHGLPTYSAEDPSNQNLTALITGANGISGYHMVKVLSAAPASRWKKICCLSRSPPQDYFWEGLDRERVEFLAGVDFLHDAGGEGVRGVLVEGGVERVDCVFFFSYVQPKQKGGVGGMWKEADELAEVNARLLRNFMEGLRLANLKPKRFLLQTGAKHYGFHIGPATNPSFESDPRVTLENSFYYPQEDLLFNFCKATGAQWSVVRPSCIIGAVRDNTLNFWPGIAVYAAVQKYLGRPLQFPGGFTAWDKESCQSTAMLNAYFEEWCVLTEQAANEAFNIQDGLNFTFSRLWPYLADWYDMPWEPPSLNESKYGWAASRTTFSLQEWSESQEVVDAWEVLSKRHGLRFDPFKDRAQVFGITDSALLGGWPLSLSMRKARKFGFHGTVDSYESAFETIKALARMGVAVPMVRGEFREDV